jgi:hypothetical protein
VRYFSRRQASHVSRKCVSGTRKAACGYHWIEGEKVKEGCEMAKKRKRKYSPSAGRDVENEMRRYKRGTAKSGKGGKAGKVKSRKQAIAIGLSKARKKGKKVPRKSA